MTTLTFILALLGAILTAALILLEIFFIPGIGILGILGVGGFIGIEIYLFQDGQISLAITFAVLTIIAFLIGFYFLSRNKFIKKVELTDTVDTIAVQLPEGISEGDTGVTTSRLTLGGTIRIGKDTLLEAESEEGFIDEGEAIYISGIRNNRVFVKRAQQDNN
ncbi:MAG: NfeD family protein [Bacteroidales bacterium]|uniref:NfeD family protein n=1 Tax=Porphyromonas sp. TaxID=1924944 RepID=UPI002977DE7D|nr:NfeD family protein [Porphyromonas sp.]MDD7438212.1 NfeD family protein [Bacteroidales bacterium]MDY3067049.1 NfeD family protein [Porphyromonas sp.]